MSRTKRVTLYNMRQREKTERKEVEMSEGGVKKADRSMWWRLETMETIAGKEQGKKKGQPGILRVLEERSWVRKKWLSTSNVNIDNWYRIINVEMAQQLRRQMRKAETGEHTIKALTKETEEMWEKLRMGKKLSFKKNLKCSQVIFYFENPKTKRQPNETLFNDYK